MNNLGDITTIKLCGNKEIYNNILLWLRNFNYKTKISVDSCIIVTGKTCVGKTYFIY